MGLQAALLTKEYKLANYLRMEIRNCMDACTTSPVESNINSIKHGSYAVHANMNLDKSTERMIMVLTTAFVGDVTQLAGICS